MADLDWSEVEAFARDLDDAAAQMVVAARQVVKKGAGKVKDRLRVEATGHRHAPRLPAAITYDVDLRGDDIVATIGPETGNAGSLAFYYLGNSRTGPVLPEPMIAADAEAEVMAQRLLDIGVEAIGG